MKTQVSKYFRTGTRMAVTAVALVAMLTMGAQAEDSVQLVDSSDLNIYRQSAAVRTGVNPNAPLKMHSGFRLGATEVPLSDVSLALQKGLLGEEKRPSKSLLSITEPRVTPTGFSLGVEVSLEDSDNITLQDHDRLYLESSFGRVDGYEALASQSGAGLLPSVMDDGQATDAVSFLSRASSLNIDTTQLSLATTSPGLLTPHYAGVRLGYSSRYGSAERLLMEPKERGFEIALTSMIMVQGANTGELSFLEAATIGSDDRAYNVGLNVGYRGFTMVASFLRGESQIQSSYQSYDLGLEYDFGAWATSLALGGYFGDAETMGYTNLFEIDRIYSVEIGASYTVRPWMKVQGRFQFFDYRTLLGGSLDGLGGTFFLGTSLGF
jgi:hypothetical protein